MTEHGLQPIFDCTNPEIDIVAVHGLNFKNESNHATNTWTKEGTMWLKDFLPNHLNRRPRILLYSYNASPALGAAALSLTDHAANLLQWLEVRRRGEPKRPLIFIGHSLGGIVVKEALLQAMIHPSRKVIFEASRLLVFFATPHRGGKNAQLGDVIAKIVRFGMKAPRNQLIEELKRNSAQAMERFERSKYLFEHCFALSFFEGQSYGKIGIIVDKESATIGLTPSIEKQVPTNGDHSTICKFDSEDGDCELVIESIVTAVDEALEGRPIPRRKSNLHWLVPRPSNSSFIGRRSIVDKIKQTLTHFNHDAQKIFILTGMGGLGKSEVCLKVAEELREKFWGIFWVDVSDTTTTATGFSDIAKMLKLQETSIEAVRRSLSNLDPKYTWLLILDNADDPDVIYQKYFPPGNRGAVLLTSRIPECVPDEKNHELGSLEKNECISLLLKLSNIEESQEVTSDAEKVVEILDSHTLAIRQAGGYIAQKACSLGKYPDDFRKQQRRLLTFDMKRIDARYLNVYAAFEASAAFLLSKQDEAARDALSVLQVLSPLHYENVPLDLLRDAWHGAQRATSNKSLTGVEIGLLTRWHVSQVPEFLGAKSHTWDEFRMSQALDLLVSLALIKKNRLAPNNIETISMHPLAHTWLDLRQDTSQKDESLLKSQCIIALSRYHQDEWRPYRHHLGNHILRVLERRSIAPDTLKLSMSVYLYIGWLLSELQHYKELGKLVRFMQTELRINIDKPELEYYCLYALMAVNAGFQNDPTHDQILEYLYKMKPTPDEVVPDHKLGCYEQPEQDIALLKEVVGEHERTLADTDPKRLISLNRLAGAYIDGGQPEQAVDLLEKVVANLEYLPDETYLFRLFSQNTLASAYIEARQVEKAIFLLERVVKILEKTPDETDLDIPVIKYLLPSYNLKIAEHMLANAYLMAKQEEKGITLLKRLTGEEKNTLEETDPSRLDSQRLLARVYIKTNQVEKAIVVLEQVVRIHERTLGETDPSRLASQYLLASAKASLNDGAAVDRDNHDIHVNGSSRVADAGRGLTELRQFVNDGVAVDKDNDDIPKHGSSMVADTARGHAGRLSRRIGSGMRNILSRRRDRNV